MHIQGGQNRTNLYNPYIFEEKNQNNPYIEKKFEKTHIKIHFFFFFNFSFIAFCVHVSGFKLLQQKQ